MSIRTIAPTETQRAAFVRLRWAFVQACSYVSAVAWDAQEFNRVRLHHLVYAEVRATHGLMAQHAIRAIGVVVDAYKLDRKAQRTFRPEGAVALDTPRLYRLEGNHADIVTLDGRPRVKLNIGGIQRGQLKDVTRLLEADLIRDRKGRWRLLVSAAYPDPTPMEMDDVLGVDLGRIDIAVTSDGATYSGGRTTAIGDRYTATRTMIQRNVSKGTRSSRRRGRATLARLSGRESRFQRNTNHPVSRRIVDTARATGRASALEDLTGIRERVNAQSRGKTERRRGNAWAFYQLRAFLTYKAHDAGRPLMLAPPAYTSQTCYRCLHLGEREGKCFSCINPSCGWAGDADFNGACMIALLGAAVTSPRGPWLCCDVQPGRRAPESLAL